MKVGSFKTPSRTPGGSAASLIKFPKLMIMMFQRLLSPALQAVTLLKKYSVALAIVFLCLIATWLFCSKYLTVELDLPRAFEVAVQPPPSKANQEGLSIQLNGVDGGKAIVGFRMGQFLKKDSGEVEYVPKEGSAEKLALTPKTLQEIQANLSDLDPQKWQVLTKLPSPIFRFNLNLESDSSSPNNAKKVSYFLATAPNIAEKKIMPGEVFTLGKSLQFQDISKTLAVTKMDLVYTMGMYMSFFNKNGEFISQATGRIVIKPDLMTRFYVFLIIWMLVLGLETLVKKTLLIPKDIEEVKEQYKQANKKRGGRAKLLRAHTAPTPRSEKEL